MLHMSGFPASGKIRENIFLLESQGKSGNFVESQGILLGLRWTRFQPWFKCAFSSNQMFVIFLPRCAQHFEVKYVMYLKVREKPHWKVRELSQNWLLGTLICVKHSAITVPAFLHGPQGRGHIMQFTQKQPFPFQIVAQMPVLKQHSPKN